MKQKLKKWLYVAGLLCMGSCKKVDPSICSSSNPSRFNCIANLKNHPADFGGSYIYFEKYGATFICPNCESKVEQMKLTITTTALTTFQPYKYRLWGQIFECTRCPIAAPGPTVKFVYIDKIELTN